MSKFQIRAETRLPTKFGLFDLIVFNYDSPDQEHVMLLAEPYDPQNALVRIHSECMTGEVFHSMRCECDEQLDHALERIGKEGGVLIYLRQEGRGIGLTNKIKAYALQDSQHLDTVDANTSLGLPVDARNYAAAVAALRKMGVTGVKLLSGNPKKAEALRANAIQCELVREELGLCNNPEKEVAVDGYLRTKRLKLGHV